MKRSKFAVAAASVVLAAAVGGIVLVHSRQDDALTGSVTRSYVAGTCERGACWTCKGRVALDNVTVIVDSPAQRVDAVKFASGCTGTIRQLVVATNSGDVVKVAEGAHDLVVGQAPPTAALAICRDGVKSYSHSHPGTCSYHGGVLYWLPAPTGGGGSITCMGHAAGIHQDGIQVMGGHDLTFRGLTIACPATRPKLGSLNHSCFFVNKAGAATEPPARVVLRDSFCASAGQTVDIATSDSSGVRDSAICPSVAVKLPFYVPLMPHDQATATNVVNVGNTFPVAC